MVVGIEYTSKAPRKAPRSAMKLATLSTTRAQLTRARHVANGLEDQWVAPDDRQQRRGAHEHGAAVVRRVEQQQQPAVRAAAERARGGERDDSVEQGSEREREAHHASEAVQQLLGRDGA